MTNPATNPASEPAADPVAWLTLQPLGERLPVQAGQTLLEAALAAGVDLPRSCRNGTCRACRCQMTAGQVRYRIAWPGLSPDEHEAGEVLPCVALPETDVTLEQPLARRASS
jgi:ferredoxin